MRTEGIVRKVENNKAYVVIKRQSACGENCANCGGCSAKENEITAKNSIGAIAGEIVVIEMCNKKVLSAAFFVYILPLLLFFADYALLYSLGFSEGICILTGVIILVAFYTLLHFIDRKNSEKYIHEIVERKK